MFIIEKPYASLKLFNTLEHLQTGVLDTPTLSDLNRLSHNLNLLNDKEAIEDFGKHPLLYSNSENSIEWVLNNLPQSDFVKNIRLFKDKTKFRKLLSPMYPDFFFREYTYEELFNISEENLPESFVIKPTVGFLSFGVYALNSKNEWQNVLLSIKNDVENGKKNFPDKVINSSKFIIEEMIEGEEYAIDAYFNENSKPVVLNILKHPFKDGKDVSDRIYITSKQIIKENLESFTYLLEEIGKLEQLKYFPMHIELRKSKSGKIVPIEVNPMRFAGWCTTDLADFAWGINVYKYYLNQITPKWNDILDKSDDEIYHFTIAEVPGSVDKSKIKSFNYLKFLKNFSHILEFRKIDFAIHPIFAIIFAKSKDYTEVERVLSQNMKDYIELL